MKNLSDLCNMGENSGEQAMGGRRVGQTHRKMAEIVVAHKPALVEAIQSVESSGGEELWATCFGANSRNLVKRAMKKKCHKIVTGNATMKVAKSHKKARVYRNEGD